MVFLGCFITSGCLSLSIHAMVPGLEVCGSGVAGVARAVMHSSGRYD